MGWSHVGLRNVPRRSWVAFAGRYLETQERLQTVPRHCIQYMTLSTECVDLFLLGCIPGASQAVPGSLPGWNNPNNPSWERLETFLTQIRQCLDDRLWSCQVEIIFLRGTSQVYQYLTKMDPGEMSPENILGRSWVIRVTSPLMWCWLRRGSVLNGPSPRANKSWCKCKYMKL